jgi:hypothetical protein
MKRCLLQPRTAKSLVACILTLTMTLPVLAADQPGDSDSNQSRPAAVSEIEQLKKMLADQQRQINELRKALQDKAAPEAAESAHPSTGQVASTTPIVPPSPAPAATSPIFNPPAIAPPQARSNDESSPLQFKLGDAYFTPVGFMDMTNVTRSTNPGSGIGTNFGSIPYGNTQGAALSEDRLSIQNSRLGMRIDALVKDWKVLGYWESDFLGQLGNPPNGGLAVSSNPYVMRLRLYWVDLRKGKNEFLAGQSWSLMTPNRKGVSPLPGDIFYSNVIDVNYQLGLTWGRIPGYRYAYHPNDKIAFAVALENSEPYIGGGNGGSAAVLPAAFSSQSGAQLNGGNSVISAPALHPDIIAKLAFDPNSRLHFEIGGVEITDKIANPTGVTGLPAFATHSKAGAGGMINLNVALTKNFRLVTNNFYSDGGGRYIFGQAPDFIVRSNGDISLVHSASTVTGFEATAGKTQFYAYYGGVYIGKNMALDANGSKIGYGSIASDGQNRAIQEVTFGSNTTLMRDSKWGAVNLMFQYSYLQRNPWLVTGTAPSNASVSMGFFNLRYTLPGSAPTLGK